MMQDHHQNPKTWHGSDRWTLVWSRDGIFGGTNSTTSLVTDVIGARLITLADAIYPGLMMHHRLLSCFVNGLPDPPFWSALLDSLGWQLSEILGSGRARVIYINLLVGTLDVWRQPPNHTGSMPCERKSPTNTEAEKIAAIPANTPFCSPPKRRREAAQELKDRAKQQYRERGGGVHLKAPPPGKTPQNLPGRRSI